LVAYGSSSLKACLPVWNLLATLATRGVKIKEITNDRVNMAIIVVIVPPAPSYLNSSPILDREIAVDYRGRKL